MKQVLLRIPDGLHRRLVTRARREGRSMNAMAADILDASTEQDLGDRQTRLRAAAAATGLLRSAPARQVTDAERERTIASTRGVGPVLDQYLAEDRDRG